MPKPAKITQRVKDIQNHQALCKHDRVALLPRFVTWKQGPDKVKFAQTCTICLDCGSFREVEWDDPETPEGNNWKFVDE